MSNNFKDSPQVRDALDRIRKGGWDNANPKDVVFYVGANINDYIHGMKEEIERQIEDVRGRINVHEELNRAIDELKGEFDERTQGLQKQLKGLKTFMWFVAGGLVATILVYFVINIWLVPRVVIR
ncbi:MAG: hypothetical protein JSV84_11010 [Gemmatimonadota bacterium]|nr:MAG: hypothetical protein JSV84_11010 [Gemmatimonadota bacterium]